MPVFVHFGPPRQGKTYSAVADQIIPALAKGRHVVTNIEGMASPERQEALLIAARKINADLEYISFNHINHSDLEKGNIFPRDMRREDEEGTRIFDDSNSVLKFGSLLVWDEARSFTTGELPTYWHEALTYHGHWVGNGFATDMVIIHQNWKSLAPLLRSVAEIVYEFVKKPGGKGYTRFYYHAPGDRDLYRSKAELTESYSFEPEVFACYKTNAGEGPVNDNVTTTFWKTKTFRRLLGAALFFLCAAGAIIYYSASRIYAENVAPAKQAEAVTKAQSVLPSFGGSKPVGPTIVGVVPQEGGDAALVREGDVFVTVRIEDGRVPWKGSYLAWPEDM